MQKGLGWYLKTAISSAKRGESLSPPESSSTFWRRLPGRRSVYIAADPAAFSAGGALSRRLFQAADAGEMRLTASNAFGRHRPGSKARLSERTAASGGEKALTALAAAD